MFSKKASNCELRASSITKGSFLFNKVNMGLNRLILECQICLFEALMSFVSGNSCWNRNKKDLYTRLSLIILD